MSDPYLTDWNPGEYLRQYYATSHVSAAEFAHYAFARRHFERTGRRFGRAVEVGCGPTLHHAALIVPHVDHLTLTDYLPANLAEVRRWLDAEPDAHDWGVYFSGLSAAADPMPLLRERVQALLPVDVRHLRPLGGMPPFDLVASYYCLECVSGEQDEWRQRLANVSRLVAPGGVLLLGALRRCHEYHVLGRVFPTALVDESDFAAELPNLGFAPAGTVIEAAPVAEWAGQGFDSICCVWAVKGGGR
jgi:SAM-dependent methyltransferase